MVPLCPQPWDLQVPLPPHLCCSNLLRDEWRGTDPDGLVVRIPGFHCCGPGSIPGQGTESLQAARYGHRWEFGPHLSWWLRSGGMAYTGGVQASVAKGPVHGQTNNTRLSRTSYPEAPFIQAPWSRVPPSTRPSPQGSTGTAGAHGLRPCTLPSPAHSGATDPCLSSHQPIKAGPWE